jgi:hypothetical protein
MIYHYTYVINDYISNKIMRRNTSGEEGYNPLTPAWLHH